MKIKFVTAFVIIALLSGAVGAQDTVEKKKIAMLISSIENLEGAIFIRNGSEYNNKKAAEHLRMKLQKAGTKVKTADDFIRLCASKSLIFQKE